MSSCNGCRALRKGCSESCILRACLDWIPSPHAQSNATLFVARFFGRSDLLTFVSSVPLHQRAALFQSLLYEACGRAVNPVSGAVGLLSTGNWSLCQAAVNTVLVGGELEPIPGLSSGEASDELNPYPTTASPPPPPRFSTKIRGPGGRRARTVSTDESAMTNFGGDQTKGMEGGRHDRKLLNLFI